MILGNPITLGGAKKKGRLPDEYQEVEYLSGTGIQYIITNCNLANITSYTIHAVFALNSVQTGYHTIAGNDTFDIRIKDGYLRSDDGTMPYLGVAKSDVIVYANKTTNLRTMSLNGEEVLNIQLEWWTTTGNIAVFTNGTNIQNRIVDAKIYIVELYFDNVQTLYLVPCYSKATNTPGFYDIINSTFLTNNGTGEFIVGPDVN